MSKQDDALELLDRGWPVIPIEPNHKRPLIKWKGYQDRLPTEAEVMEWWDQWPEAEIALVTGQVAGVLVVDCDNEDALHAAFDAGMRSPIKVKTKRGWHLYFKHPRDGVRRGPRAGVNSRGQDWPKIDGLDFRGDGSYALLPPSTNYSWEIEPGLDIEDDMPIWQDWRPKLKPKPVEGGFSFESMDLTGVRPLDDYVKEWDRTAKYVREKFPSTLKIPSGMSNGRNERVMRHLSDCVLEGCFGSDLRVRGHAFMREFFEEELSEAEFEATARSVEEMERRNHPERFDEEGRYIFAPHTTTVVTEKEAKTERRLVQMGDADELLRRADAQTYLIEPWLPPQTIVQVHGYSGHGKSMFVQHAMAALSAGKKYFGPFEIGEPARVLYFDYENGMATIARRLKSMGHAHGDSEDRLNIWAPFVDDKPLNLRTAEGRQEFQKWIEFAKPQVVVIDTIRTAFSGLDENVAKDWATVNDLAMRIRNAGHAVIMLHHSNKPGDDGRSGREAGSTNQLTVLETQIKITQVYADKDVAALKAGIFDGDYNRPVWPQLEAKLSEDMRLQMVMEVRYGKVREWTELHDDVQWIGLAHCLKTNRQMLVSSRSTKQKAKELALEGFSLESVATQTGKPVPVVREWLKV